MCFLVSFLPLQSSINDGADFKAVADAMKVIGFTGDEVQTVYKILATILHLVILDNIKSLLVSLSRQLCASLDVVLCIDFCPNECQTGPVLPR